MESRWRGYTVFLCIGPRLNPRQFGQRRAAPSRCSSALPWRRQHLYGAATPSRWWYRLSGYLTEGEKSYLPYEREYQPVLVVRYAYTLDAWNGLHLAGVQMSRTWLIKLTSMLTDQNPRAWQSASLKACRIQFTKFSAAWRNKKKALELFVLDGTKCSPACQHGCVQALQTRTVKQKREAMMDSDFHQIY